MGLNDLAIAWEVPISEQKQLLFPAWQLNSRRAGNEKKFFYPSENSEKFGSEARSVPLLQQLKQFNIVGTTSLGF